MLLWQAALIRHLYSCSTMPLWHFCSCVSSGSYIPYRSFDRLFLCKIWIPFYSYATMSLFHHVRIDYDVPITGCFMQHLRSYATMSLCHHVFKYYIAPMTGCSYAKCWFLRRHVSMPTCLYILQCSHSKLVLCSIFIPIPPLPYANTFVDIITSFPCPAVPTPHYFYATMFPHIVMLLW